MRDRDITALTVGRYVPETLMRALGELEEVYSSCRQDPDFLKEFHYYLEVYAGGPPRFTGRSVFPANSG